MKKSICFVLVALLLFSLCACGAQNPFSSLKEAAQMGKADPDTDKKETEKGSLSNPYSLNETITVTSYDAQGYNYATGVRTVANPATWELTVGDIMTLYGEFQYLSGPKGDTAFLVPVTVKIVSLTGDTLDWYYDGLTIGDISIVTKDRREIRSAVEFPQEYFHEENIYESPHGTRYEGSEFTFLVGGVTELLGLEVSSAEDLDLLKFEYYDEAGDEKSVYVSLH